MKSSTVGSTSQHAVHAVTDLEVEFDIPPEPELLPKPLIDKETIVNNNEETLINTEPECTKLTRKQLREARLKFYSGLKL